MASSPQELLQRLAEKAGQTRPVMGPRLKALLVFVLSLLAVLGANSAYLGSITALEWLTGLAYQNYFYQVMFLAHLGLGLLLVLPFVVFGLIHLVTARDRRNRRAVRVGYALFAVSLGVLVTGVLLMRVGGFDLRQPLVRATVYWLHLGLPLAAGWLYWLHRLVGTKIRWRLGLAYAGAVAVAVAAMVLLHQQDPRSWNVVGPKEGERYFRPSLARTTTGNFIPAQTLMMDSYCEKCHQDVYNGWFHSAHHFSSFNNPAYLASIRETREVVLKRDGNVQASRWCAGCHDPVPFFSGAFDDPNFDLVKHATAQAGITCTTCHAITHVNSTRGNADFTIDEPIHYPFAFSENPLLQYVNQQLVKAKPAFHKQVFLKPLHKTAEFCSTCHKVHLPYELNKYKEFLRGQNHYDSYLLSGVSGHGARSFYYPPQAKTSCAACHMPLQVSQDFGAQLFEGAAELSVHDHFFPAANTALPYLRDEPELIARHEEFLKDVMRVDLFGLREGGAIDGKLLAPLRPQVPVLQPGEAYLLEAVVRTLKMGHHFTQGTVDSNEVWLDVTVSSGDRLLGRSGGIDAAGEVDPWSHFLNVYMLDRHGNRIARRNPQDIFVPLYNKQIPPGAAQVAHYAFRVPEDARDPITVEIRLLYRKFDKQYMDFVTGSSKPGDNPIFGYEVGSQQPYVNALPIVTLASDRATFSVAGGPPAESPPEVKFPAWQRWNDYGIALLQEGQASGLKGAEFRAAAEAFAQVEALGRFDGPLNLARVLVAEGRLDEAVAAVNRAAAFVEPENTAPAWTLAWLTGVINRQHGNLEAAEQSLRSVLTMRTEEMLKRRFDFSLDLEVVNELGAVLFDRARQQRGAARATQRDAFLQQAAEQFQRTLEIDSENVAAHYNLHLIYQQLGDAERAAFHDEAHRRYKLDDNARQEAIRIARLQSAAANHASEAIVIYDLQRAGAPGLADVPPAAAPLAGGGGGP